MDNKELIKKVMKYTILFLALAMVPAFAQAPTAHVVGIERGLQPSGSWACFYELRVDYPLLSRTYTALKAGRCDKAVAVGMDLSFAIDGRYLRLNTPDGKELRLVIQGTHE
jgi:hypothetical protein